jgi:glyoxylase-like metal-dependent hydrolase (beta-lactamase superfamily II)
VYFRQWLSGRDFAVGDQMALSMRNFVYAIGDPDTGDAVIIDPAYRPDELVELVHRDGMKVSGVLATHYHFDHVGGEFAGHHVAGIAELLAERDVPIHVQKSEVEWIEKRTGVGADSLVAHDPSDVLRVGDVEVELLHTPGHTPGSQCFVLDGALISGDTLFLDGCGRTDLPGSNPQDMYYTLHQRLSKIPARSRVYPGHLYSELPWQEMGEVRSHNYVMAPRSADEWLAMFGR